MSVLSPRMISIVPEDFALKTFCAALGCCSARLHCYQQTLRRFAVGNKCEGNL